MRYEADEQPHSEVWLELDESERIDAVMDYHRRTRVKLENPELHATAHVVVENQVALGEATSVPATLDRLVYVVFSLRHFRLARCRSLSLGGAARRADQPSIGQQRATRSRRLLADFFLV